MSTKVTDGLMVGFAAAGVLALFATAEFGIAAAIVGAGISAVSGAMAVKRIDQKNTATPGHSASLNRTSGHAVHSLEKRVPASNHVRREAEDREPSLV